VSRKDAELVDKLAAAVGIEPEYYDNWGNKHITSYKTKKAILAAMGISDIKAALKQRQLRPWNRLIEPVMVVSVNNQPETIPVHFPLDEGQEKDVTLTWYLEDETGNKNKGEIKGITPVDSNIIDDSRYVRVELPNETNRDIGYYKLNVQCKTPAGELSGFMRLIITPDQCYIPPSRTWGISINLYSIRSRQNWGIGDLSDLKDIVQWVSKDLGGGFVGINPLHAIPNKMPYGISPYSATSRLFKNFIYLDIRNISSAPQFQNLLNSPEFAQEIENLKTKELIDYENTASLKMKALKAAFSTFNLNTAEGAEFKRYIDSEGRALESFATFMALEEHFKKDNPDLYRWQDWPEEYHHPDTAATEEFRKTHKKEVLFYQYIQWLIDKQLKAVSDKTKELGMPVGLYHDLAVGSSGGGSDAWSYPDVFAFGVNAGAPPDAFNLNGQNWGFPPLIPEKLKESGYELFIQTIRKNLKYAGALRIDHALGLFRLFWIPEGMTPHEGTYVRYPYEDLLRIIALESVRNNVVIIAEDLGTIGSEVRETLLKFGMLSYRLFYFERDWNTFVFLPPEVYPEMALTAVTTHDLPTLYGYWTGRDIAVKHQLGIYPDDEAVQKDLSERQRDRQLMLDALRDFLPEGFPQNAQAVPEMTPELCLSIHTYLARTPCKLVAVNLDDIMAVIDQQNMPGTIDTHPNWRQKAPLDLKDLFTNEQAKNIALMFKGESRS
jgi:4-alpha-glucanotransferase